MKFIIVSLISALTLAAAGQANKEQMRQPPEQEDTAREAPAKDAATRKAAAKEPPAREAPKIAIPAGAVPSDNGDWRYTDDKGRKWIYRKTPFGISRAEDKPVEAKAAEAKAEEAKAVESKSFENVKATEDGDSIRFERPGPFGTYKWQRKKTELNEMEQAAWDREKSRAAAKQD